MSREFTCPQGHRWEPSPDQTPQPGEPSPVCPVCGAAAARPGTAPLPSMHSDLYYPVPEPSLKTGVRAMSSAVLNLLGK